jgi:hypothetical protein
MAQSLGASGRESDGSLGQRPEANTIPEQTTTDQAPVHAAHLAAERSLYDTALKVTHSRWFIEACGILWVVGAAVAVLVPALHHGSHLGSFDVLTTSGLTRRSGAVVHNSVTTDQIDAIIPWSTLAWTQVHHLQIPLWNPYNGLGMPLAFNWQSAVLSPATVVSYLVPLRFAYSAQILVTLLIAGVGVYLFGRLLNLGVLACVTAATMFELSGSFIGWLGWPHASVMAWAGWLFSAIVLTVRLRHRLRSIALTALVLACAIYSGQPEIFTILTATAAVFTVTLLIQMATSERTWRAVVTPLLDLTIGAVAGFAWSAPLTLPGLQLVLGSTRRSGNLSAFGVGKALPFHDLAHLLVQGYNGVPLSGGQMFGDTLYVETAAYVGVIAVVLAVMGVALCRHRPGVVALAAVGVFALLVVYAPPVEALISRLPFVQTIDWHRALMSVSFAIAVLAGFGMDVLVRSFRERRVQRWAAAGFLGCGVLVLALWLFGGRALTPAQVGIRHHSLIWPTAAVIVGIALIGLPFAFSRRAKASTPIMPTGHRFQSGAATGPTDEMAPASTTSPAGRRIGILLLVFETVFLVSSGAPLWSSSASGTRPTPAVVALKAATRGATVGFGTFTCFAGPGSPSIGILPNANILYDVHEFDIYDPVLPRAYNESWLAVSGQPGGVSDFSEFCPAVTSAALARRFGVGFVLEPPNHTGPTGGEFAGTVGDETLYRIPGAGAATLAPLRSSTQVFASGTSERSVAVASSSPSRWRIVTSGSQPQRLRLRLTDVPGWHATIDGRPLALDSYSGIMMQANVPAGHHVVELRYWPQALTVGIVFAVCCSVALLIAMVVGRIRHAAVSEPGAGPGAFPGAASSAPGLTGYD